MPQQTMQQFGQTIKAKHPEYGDLSDEDVATKVLAKYPQYHDMVSSDAPSRPAGLPAGMALPSLSSHASAPAMSPDVASNGSDTGGSRMSAAAYNVGGHAIDTVKGAVEPFLHPINALKTYPGSAGAMQQIGDQAAADRRMLVKDPVRLAETVTGDLAGNIALGAATHAGAKFIPEAIAATGRKAMSPLRGSLDETIPGTSTTPRARYQAAKRLGVKLDLADATNSAPANIVKHIGRDSLAGSGVYEKAKANNLGALGDSTDAMLDTMSPLDRETGGFRLQDLLKQDQAKMKAAADAGYGEIDAKYGNSPMLDHTVLSDAAKGIQQQQAQHLAEFPSLRPSKVGAVVEDASNYGASDPPKVSMSPLVDAKGKAMPSSVQPSPTPSPVIRDALKARSGILDMYANNPEIVKTAADAQLQRLTGAAHDAIMGSLPPEAQQTLRNAQTTFKEMKQAYDNPSSPLYDAIRTDNPSGKVSGIGPKTPENVRSLTKRIGDEGKGIIQRGTAEKLLGTAPGSEEYNFRSFPTQLSRLPADYAGELFGQRLSGLKDVSSTAQALSRDLNPSGTAKQAQKLAEAAALIPTGGLPLLQYPLARLMNSPGLVDFVMRESQQPQRLSAPSNSNVITLPLAAKKNGTSGR